MLVRLTPNASMASMYLMANNSSMDDTTFQAVIRSSSDYRRILAKSDEWATREDAEILGVNRLREDGWMTARDRSGGVLCIEEVR